LDGGINGIYKGERFVVIKDGHPFSITTEVTTEVTMQCKLEVDFRPRGISNEIYNDPDRFAAWSRSHPRPGGRWRALDLVRNPLRFFDRKKKTHLIFRGSATDVIVRASTPYVAPWTPD
jgi:hypothetical protein